jgi:hypothetical protein
MPDIRVVVSPIFDDSKIVEAIALTSAFVKFEPAIVPARCSPSCTLQPEDNGK